MKFFFYLVQFIQALMLYFPFRKKELTSKKKHGMRMEMQVFFFEKKSEVACKKRKRETTTLRVLRMWRKMEIKSICNGCGEWTRFYEFFVFFWLKNNENLMKHGTNCFFDGWKNKFLIFHSHSNPRFYHFSFIFLGLEKYTQIHTQRSAQRNDKREEWKKRKKNFQFQFKIMIKSSFYYCYNNATLLLLMLITKPRAGCCLTPIVMTEENFSFLPCCSL